MTGSARRTVRRGLGLVTLAAVAVGAAAGCGDDSDAAADDGGGTATSTTMATGGIEIDAPDGWTAVPLPVLGFGLALPPGWEATRLDEQGLSSTGQAEPLVPGFVEAAHRAAASGVMFYAAAVDADDQVTDLEVRVFEPSAIADTAALEAMASQLATDQGWTSPTIEPVDAAQPTVQVRFRTQAARPTDDDPNQTEDVAVEGTERLVLSPSGAIYSFVLTSEDRAIHDDLAGQVLDTVAFPPS